MQCSYAAVTAGRMTASVPVQSIRLGAIFPGVNR